MRLPPWMLWLAASLIVVGGAGVWWGTSYWYDRQDTVNLIADLGLLNRLKPYGDGIQYPRGVTAGSGTYELDQLHQEPGGSAIRVVGLVSLPQ